MRIYLDLLLINVYLFYLEFSSYRWVGPIQSEKSKRHPGPLNKISLAEMNVHTVWEFVGHTGKNPSNEGEWTWKILQHITVEPAANHLFGNPEGKQICCVQPTTWANIKAELGTEHNTNL